MMLRITIGAFDVRFPPRIPAGWISRVRAAPPAELRYLSRPESVCKSCRGFSACHVANINSAARPERADPRPLAEEAVGEGTQRSRAIGRRRGAPEGRSPPVLAARRSAAGRKCAECRFTQGKGL